MQFSSLTYHKYHSSQLSSADDPNNIWQRAWLLSGQTLKAFSFPVIPKLKLFKLLHTRGFKKCIAHLNPQDMLTKLVDFCVAKCSDSPNNGHSWAPSGGADYFVPSIMMKSLTNESSHARSLTITECHSLDNLTMLSKLHRSFIQH